MKILKKISYLVMLVIFVQNCEADKKNNDTLIAGLAIASLSNCFSVPAQAIVKDGNAATTVTYNCTVSGKVYTCEPTGGGNKVVRTYSSATAAKLGVVDPPSLSNQHVQRGLEKRTEGATETNFVYNASNQLQSVSSPTVTYSNYDDRGFPRSNSSGSTITYTYEGSRTIPTTVSDAANTYTYDNRGWATKVSFGFGNPTTVEYSGSLGICQ
ncbi:hypothetical protein [Leptospira bandrabouensis]|uniref:YD repeat-containing protein n=1 Tax=Leptospira bandrabouensis TaxID=2484903 RepID=A0A6H3NVL6_9LEPT|nr:hypothetical protein [Leptospira bandrabouensis]MCG6143418.1 hypothetical protein [Leptospira bandrabouensis]MCG6159078.1 hypothetical protein [Leptospira bandrabouensis]MCG6163012.1 hypothetical protein [Leptospira bandrabouensis]TGN04693.1 hypothetical protein EHR07_08655 [Leptospira bandrabouensis]TGN15021.1 hypothetical protein EHR08_01570 [Leptospira bandrabouensis]